MNDVLCKNACSSNPSTITVTEHTRSSRHANNYIFHSYYYFSVKIKRTKHTNCPKAVEMQKNKAHQLSRSSKHAK